MDGEWRRSYLMTVQPLTQELFDQYVRHQVPVTKYHELNEYNKLYRGGAEIALVMHAGLTKPVLRGLGRMGWTPEAVGLTRLTQLEGLESADTYLPH